jgi:hypothetical protein
MGLIFAYICCHIDVDQSVRMVTNSQAYHVTDAAYIHIMRYEVFMVMRMWIVVFQVRTKCSLAGDCTAS